MSGPRRWAHYDEFAMLFQTMDTPLIQPGGRARAINDARDRVLAWGTLNLPHRTVVSPVPELRSGLIYAARSSQYAYAGAPNTPTFPNCLSPDLVVYKTFSAKGRHADVGVPVFNLMHRWNPCDVFPVLAVNPDLASSPTASAEFCADNCRSHGDALALGRRSCADAGACQRSVDGARHTSTVSRNGDTVGDSRSTCRS